MATKKEIVMAVDMAASIFAILLLGVFLGQAIVISGITPSITPSACFVFGMQGVLIVAGYLMFQYSLKKTFGPDVLKG